MPGFIFLLFSLSVPIALEGVGIVSSQLYFLLYYLLLPSFLYIYAVASKAKLKAPPVLLSLVFLFLLLSSISSLLFSLDKQASVERLLFYLILCLLFLFGYNFRGAIRRQLALSLPLLGVFFLIYSLAVHWAVFEKQVVFASYGSHNHLGDFLGVALIVLASLKPAGWKRRVRLLLMPVFFFGIVFSYSRSAYTALAPVILIFLFTKRRHLSRRVLLVGLTALSALMISLTLSSSIWIRPGTPFASLQSLARNNAGLIPRDFLSGHDAYFMQSVASIKKYPLFGIGGGNFYKASQAAGTAYVSDSAHNLFLELAVEQGVPAAIVFAVIWIILVLNGMRKKSVWGFLLLYLFINFQTDYTYQILLFPILGTLFAGSVYEEHGTFTIPVWAFGLSGIVLAAVTVCIMTGNMLLLSGRPLEALKWYPLNKDAYTEAVAHASSWDEANRYLSAATAIAPDDAAITLTAAQAAQTFGKSETALELYEQIYRTNPSLNFEIVTRMYALKKSIISKNAADRFLTEVLLHYKKNDPTTESFRKKVGRFCNLNSSPACANTGWFFME